jgi:hypothetical protein
VAQVREGGLIVERYKTIAAFRRGDVDLLVIKSSDGEWVKFEDVKEKLTEFIKSQESVPPEFVEAVNEHFWDLI